jgi:hypothetical protein
MDHSLKTNDILNEKKHVQSTMSREEKFNRYLNDETKYSDSKNKSICRDLYAKGKF